MERQTLLKMSAGLSLKILLPTVVITGVVFLVAAVKGWTPPLGLSILSSETGEAKPPADWCPEHGVPESLCTLCNPALKEKSLWCGEHGLTEDLCTLCHPELAGRFDVCREHRLPPSFCPQCADAIADSVRQSTGGDPDSGQKATRTTGAEVDLPLVRLASRRIVEDAGIVVAPTHFAEVTNTVTGNGVVTYNQNRYAQVRPRVEGFLREVLVDVGAKVRRGDVLARVDSSGLGSAKADYLAALALVELAQRNVERMKSLSAKGITPQKNLLEAETHLREDQVNVVRTRQALLNLGVTHRQIDRFVTVGEPDSILEITAPQDGVVVERHAVEGEAVEPTSHLFTVTDLTTMWVVLDLYERDVLRVAVGQSVAFHVPAFPSDEFIGTLTWISPEVNSRTRTVRARVEVENPNALLRANLFGKATIATSEPHQTLVVPKEAVQTHEGIQLVFVKKSDTVFEPRPVRVGQKNGRHWEIVSGVQPGEEVVTTGSFLFKTELQKGAIGGGCCAE